MTSERSFHKGIDLHLKSRVLPAPLLIRFFVEGDSRDNYELYLTELVNCSEYFLGLSHGSQYEYSEKQAHGECDAITKDYELDYKLTESSSRMQAARLHASQITVAGGITMFSAARETSDILATYLHSGLRAIKSFEEIESIISENPSFVLFKCRCN